MERAAEPPPRRCCPWWKALAALVVVVFLVELGADLVYESHDLQHLFVFASRLPQDPRLGRTLLAADNDTDWATPQPRDANVTLCPAVPPNLEGRVELQLAPAPLEQVECLFPRLEGGAWRPPRCDARDAVAIVVPYRNRTEHLSVLLRNLHPLLQKQLLDYRIIVVDQQDDRPFNRGALMNVGFVEALQLQDFDCFIFHDVDLIPEDDRNLYSCPEQPRHMSVAIDIFQYRLPYEDIFGGVSAMSREHFEKINGFSNEFWGWGGEDDDVSNRLRYHKLRITRYGADVARYKMLSHKPDKPNPDRFKKLRTGRRRYKTDGLNSLRYRRKSLELFHAYTLVAVELLQ